MNVQSSRLDASALVAQGAGDIRSETRGHEARTGRGNYRGALEPERAPAFSRWWSLPAPVALCLLLHAGPRHRADSRRRAQARLHHAGGGGVPRHRRHRRGAAGDRRGRGLRHPANGVASAPRAERRPFGVSAVCRCGCLSRRRLGVFARSRPLEITAGTRRHRTGGGASSDRGTARRRRATTRSCRTIC